MKTSTMTITFKCFMCFMSYRNINTQRINRCAQIYKFIKMFICFYPWSSWINDDVFIHTHLDYFNTTTSYGSKFILQTLILVYKKKTYCICLWNSFMFNVSIFYQISKHNSTFAPKKCPIIILWDFNVDIIEDENHAKIYKTISFYWQIQIKIII